MQSPKKAARSRKSIAHTPFLGVNKEKENATVDLAVSSTSVAPGIVVAKRARSKSIGPGGLDALKEDAGNRRQSAVVPFVKSILKPSAPISPTRRSSPRNKSLNFSPKKSTADENQLKPVNDEAIWKSSNPPIGTNRLPNPFEASSGSAASESGPASPAQHGTRVVVRSEEEQQAAAKERERQELLLHREARRKSLANRRVSFAPEATLHTWDVVELPEDSTISSASTNLTRRASALSAIAASPFPSHSPMRDSDASEPPSTPPAQVEEIQLSSSPSHQRDPHQKKHRRSSVIPPMNFNNPDDFSSSPCSKASANENENENQAFRERGQDNDDSNSDDNDLSEGESTMTEVTAGDLTAHSHGDSSTGSSGRLEEALRLAARQAGTQGIEYDENGDITMELADDEITSAFQPWMGGSEQVPQTIGSSVAFPEQENINPFSPAFSANMTQAAAPDEAGKTMEFTQSVGTILTNANECQSSDDYLQVAGGSARRISAGGHYRSSSDSSVFGDETMDLTTAIGTIQQNQQAPSVLQPTQNWDSGDEDEELTMDFTSAVGGLLGQFSAAQEAKVTMVDRQSPGGDLLEEGNSGGSKRPLCPQEEMNTTITVGGVLDSVAQSTEPPGDQTIEMDMTTAIGAILSQDLSHCSQAKDMSLIERKTKTEHPICSASFDDLPASFKPFAHVATMTSETGSPSLMSFQRRVSAKNIVHQRQSTTPKPASMQCTPTKKITSTPSLLGHTTPSKTSPSRNIIKNNASPKKLVKPQTPERSPAQLQTQAAQLFTRDSRSGEATPSIVLKPPFRRSSGMGVDKPGLGSPRVTALLERRRSIGNDAKTFILQNEVAKSVTFANTQHIKDDLETQDAEDDRMSGRGVLQTGIHHPKFGEEKDTTANLKDLIESLTPRKKKLNGRKSLHVGAAKGLLGKRPVELDEDDDEDSTPKRLKGREGSPVKKIRLPAPPTKNETTGRITRSARRSLEEISDNKTMRTPTQLGKAFGIQSLKEETTNDVDNLSNVERFLDASNEKAPSQKPNAVGFAEVVDRVHLQDFLNMTNIRFMELTTTKRRLTVAPNLVSEKATNNQSAGMGDIGALERKGSELEQCVVAGACTIPMLELYQHSCRELKKYIAEGRSIVREIENDTYEENPPLFREYISASPETKSIMDNQFKNVKTHARLLSKAMWYEWRMKLLDSLKEGLIKVADEMDGDDDLLLQQHKVLERDLPQLVRQHDELEVEKNALQARADELDSYDHEELKAARSELVEIEKEIEAERKLVNEFQHELRCKEDGIEHAVDSRQRYLEQIAAADKVRLESRGWSSSEITSLQACVRALEKAHHWTITSAGGTSLTMTYKRTLQLYFNPASFMRNKAVCAPAGSAHDSPISLTYIGDAQGYHPQPLSTEKRFFLQIMRAHLQCMPQSKTKLKDLLKFVSSNWETACAIGEETRILGISYITEPTILLDELMEIKVVLLLRDMKTKLHVGFEVKVQSYEKAIALDVSVQPTAKVIYGEELKEKKMAEFLEQKVSGKAKAGNDVGIWARAVLELEQRLIARGRK